MYREGSGVARDAKQAVVWWRKAAEQGSVEAQHLLSVLHHDVTIKAGVVSKSSKSKLGGFPCAYDGCSDHRYANMKCTGCRRVWYHSKKCQHADWQKHKRECKKWKAQAELMAAGAGAGADTGAGAGAGGTSADSAGVAGTGAGAGAAFVEHVKSEQPQHTTALAGASGKSSAAMPREASADEAQQSKGDEEAECPICFELLVDPIAPCQVSEHKFCRAWVEGMRSRGVNNACPQCRGERRHADGLN
jgi:hypothetical protein